MPDRSDDRENLALAAFGFAPGNYSCRCGACKAEFIGDKRAVRCEACARKAFSLSPDRATEASRRHVAAGFWCSCSGCTNPWDTLGTKPCRASRREGERRMITDA